MKLKAKCSQSWNNMKKGSHSSWVEHVHFQQDDPLLCLWLEIHSKSNYTNHINRLLFASHILTGTNKPQIAALTHPRAPVRSRARGFLMHCRNVCCEKTTSTRASNIKPRECETVLRELERSPLSPVGSACRGLPSSGWQSRTDSLRNVSPPQKALCPVWFQPVQNKERTSMFGRRGVWTQTDRVCVWGGRLHVTVSAGVNRDIVDCLLLFFVCLFTCVDWAWLQVLMLNKSLCAQKEVCGMCFFVFWCVCSPVAAEDRLGEQLEMGWEKHEERPCALQKQRNAFDKDTAAS